MYLDDPYAVQKLYEQVRMLQHQIHDMNQRMITLEEEVHHMRSEKQVYIDRIEYKFDQLKVEQLEGTLNIGLSPQDREAIEQYVVGDKMDWGEEVNDELLSRIQRQIHTYLQHDVFEDVKEIEEKYSYRLDDPYRNFIVEDIKRQIDKRMTMYLNHLERNDPQNPNKEQIVIEKVRNDIHQAIEAFIKHLPKQAE